MMELKFVVMKVFYIHQWLSNLSSMLTVNSWLTFLMKFLTLSVFSVWLRVKR